MSKDTKQIIRELVEEVIEEMTATGAVAGYQTPAAFRGHKSKKKSAERSMPGGKVVGKEDTDDTTVGEGETLTLRREVQIMEGKEHERCVACDEPTGKAGKEDDSLYVDGNGPYCEDCYEKTIQSISDEENRYHGEDMDQSSRSGLSHTHSTGTMERMEEGRSRYRNFKESDMMKNHAKISYGINQAKKMLGEVEYLLNICERLKTEADVPTKSLWARTQPDMKEIHSRLKEIANRINRMGK
jgi:hypothetical protein